jgi:hypothetical protein
MSLGQRALATAKFAFFGVIVAALSAGCAKPPTLTSVMKARYPGYGQILPWAEVRRGEPDYPYIPGTVASVDVQSPATRREAPTLAFAGDYCPPGFSLARIRPVRLADTTVVYDFEIGLRRQRDKAAARAEADLALDEGDIRYLRRVMLRITRARAYPLSATQGRKLRHATSCLTAIEGRPGLHRVTSIIAGDVSVEIAFKTSVDLTLRAATQGAVLTKLQFALGFGYFDIQGSKVSGANIAFGAKLARFARAGGT